MGYPIYKLLRAVNRQYPNNGFINYVSVTDSVYDSDDPDEDKLIPEDLRDIINEAVQEVYKDVALDEVWSFPTVPGQNQYELPEDCDLRDIQEVTRTFRGVRGPLCPPPFPPPLPTTYTMYFDPGDGTGVMEPMEAEIGEKIILPECEFEPPEGKEFDYWLIGEDKYYPGDEYEMQADFIATAMWKDAEPVPPPTPDTYRVTIYVGVPGTYCTIQHQLVGGDLESTEINYYGEPYEFDIPQGTSIGDNYAVMASYSGSSLIADYTDITPTEDTRIPVIMSTINEIKFRSDLTKGSFADSTLTEDGYSIIIQNVIDRIFEIPTVTPVIPNDSITGWTDGVNTYTDSELFALTITENSTFTAIWASSQQATPQVEPEDEQPGGE